MCARSENRGFEDNKKPTIVVVEDDLSLNKLLQRIIARSGYKVTGADTGQKGIDIILASRDVFLILDYYLPDMKGDRFVKILSEKSFKIPFLVLTGQGDEQTAVEMMKAGAMDYVMKTPDLIDFLPEILDRAIEKVETEKKLAYTEEELRTFNKELEGKVRLRTAELSNANARLKEEITTRQQVEEKLRQTMSDLEISNQELEQFAYQASHDLKEPIRKVYAFAKLLKSSFNGTLTEDQIENFTFMIDGAERMIKLIDGLLVYSRITSRSLPFHQTDLAEIIDNVIRFDISELIRETEGHLTIVGDLPSVSCDKIQMQELFQNLLSNALKFHRKNEAPRVQIYLSELDNCFEINIKDNGVGILNPSNDDIFTMFTRLNWREYKGNGIGLAVCKKIVARHGGEIGYRENPDGGSIFWFTLQKT
ncbi:response regulator [bacterium]|nr:response regulator [bacterium]